MERLYEAVTRRTLSTLDPTRLARVGNGLFLLLFLCPLPLAPMNLEREINLVDQDTTMPGHVVDVVRILSSQHKSCTRFILGLEYELQTMEVMLDFEPRYQSRTRS